MTEIIFFLPHKKLISGDIHTSPHHRWEHLFVNSLCNLQYIQTVRGMTTNKYTALFVELSICDSELLNRCIYNIRYKKILEKAFLVETIVIDLELACLEFIYHKKIGFCENGKPMNIEEMQKFRKSEYIWDQVKIIKNNSNQINLNKINVQGPQSFISVVRNEMMDNFKSNNIMLKNITARNGYAFVLYRLNYENGALSTGQWKSIVKMLDGPKGFLNTRVKRHFALSFLFWPSWEETEFRGFQLFSFIEVKNIYKFWEIIVEHILKKIKVKESNKCAIKRYLLNTSVLLVETK